MDYPTIIYIIAGLLIGIGLIAFLRKEKKVAGFPKFAWAIVGLLGVAVFLWQYGLFAQWGVTFLPAPLVGNIQGVPYTGVTPSTPTQVTTTGGCLTADTTTITLSATDKYLSTSTAGSHRYRINGNPAKTVTDASTFSASPGDTINVMWMNESKAGYFAKLGTYQVPCAGTATFTEKTSKNGTLTVTLFNDPNNVAIDGGVTNQSMGAGDIKNVKMVVQGDFNKDFPYGFVMVADANKTTMDDVVITLNGQELQSASLPQASSANYGSESQRKAYSLPESMSNTQYTYIVVLDADDTNAPLADGSDVILTFFPKTYSINDKNGGAYEGPSAEDEYSAVTRTGQISATLHIT